MSCLSSVGAARSHSSVGFFTTNTCAVRWPRCETSPTSLGSGHVSAASQPYGTPVVRVVHHRPTWPRAGHRRPPPHRVLDSDLVSDSCRHRVILPVLGTVCKWDRTSCSHWCVVSMARNYFMRFGYTVWSCKLFIPTAVYTSVVRI